MRDFLALAAVRVQPSQRRFTKHPLLTYLQSRHPAVTTFCVQRERQQVGYVMLIHAENPTQWIIERLTIDRESQGAGLGYAVADQLIDMVHGFENSEMVIARYHPDNGAARALFAKLNFVERDEMFRGRHIALLEFEFEEDAEEQPKDADIAAETG
ncbi:MAG: GNAT family N-acetyltransferase [Chloroflexi bacterium]|nr:GNAT family N-acetyltransferase [Chloroflexota bacterium]